MFLRKWRERRRRESEARRLVAAAFDDPDLLRRTSLRPRHRNRWVLVDYEVDGNRIATIRFGILRHPRPYGFSRQSHKVLECYEYEVDAARIQVMRGHNLTREKGLDADG